MGRFLLMLSGGCCAALLFSGCAFIPGTDDIESDARISTRLSVDEEEKVDELNRALETSRSEADQCRRDRDRLAAEFEKIDAEVGIRHRQIESLNQTIEKQAAVISLQNTIIRLFDDSHQTLQASLREQIEAGDLETGSSTQSVKYIFSNKLLFETGGVGLSAEGEALLTKLVDVLSEESYPYVRVLGHTDNRPLKSSARFADNWELSTARAVAVVRFLHETLGIEPDRLSAVGCGQYMPVADNDTEDGRAMNRRIEIILEAGDSPAATVEIPSL